MLLILTNSTDGTTDEIVRRIGTDRCFRFNIDLWRDYSVAFSASGFAIADPTGRAVASREVRACYLRKPSFDDPTGIAPGGSPEAWARSQISYLVGEIYNWCDRDCKIRLVERGAQQRFGKVAQMAVAAKYFSVPRWRIMWTAIGKPLNAGLSGTVVAKPLTADFVENYQFFYTTEVDPSRLDPSFPWFLQSKIEADYDLTVVYVAGQCFGFTVERNLFEGADWRRTINRVDLPWKPFALSPGVASSIRAFMGEARLKFGRLDFLIKGTETFFLEVNPNGQWGWLDPRGENGVFDAVVAELVR